MPKVLLKEVVERIKDKVDKDNTHLKYYIGGEHFDYGEVCVTKRALIEGSTIGPAFHMRFMPGDVLLMSRNPHLRKSGVVDFEGLCSDVSYVCRTKNEGILMQSYLPFIFQTDHFWDFAEQNKHGSTNYFLNWTDFEKYEFELPTIEIQKELVKVLWEAQKLKMGYQKMLLATDELVKSQFIEMFGDPITNERCWNYKKLNEVTQIVLGSTPKTGNELFWNGDIKWITPAEIVEDSFYISDTVKHITPEGVKDAGLKPFPAGTVIFSTRAPIGKTAIAACEMYCNQGFKNFICGSEINPVYLFYLLRMKKDYFDSMGSGTTFRELSRKALETVGISVPSLELQNRFELLYRQSDKSKYHEQKYNSCLMKGGLYCA